MSSSAFDQMDRGSTPVDTSNGGDAPLNNEAGSGEGHSTQEAALLKAECERLSALLTQTQKERDSYMQVVYHYLLKEFTREEIEASAAMEEGVGFDVILHDMEQILNHPAVIAKS